jgi:hypothetical protein
MHTERKMMLMKSISPTPENEIEVLLNLIEREIVVKFPLLLPSSSHQDRLENRLFKFRVPLEKLKQVFVETSNTAHRVITIPFDSPPEFFLRTNDIKSTHDDSEKTWCERQIWTRETDIAKDRTILDTAPARFRKENCIIDIGKPRSRMCYFVTLLKNFQDGGPPIVSSLTICMA